MKYIILLALLVSTASFGQNFDNLLTKKQIDCPDIAYNSAQYFVKYMDENKIDSAHLLLDYWQSKCGLREPVFRAKLLLALKTQTFSDSLITDKILDYIFMYRNRLDFITNPDPFGQRYEDYKSYLGFVPPGEAFDTFTRQLASTLKWIYPTHSTEYMLAEFYGDNPDEIFTKIQTGTYSTSPLAIEYNKTVNRFINLPEAHMSWITGVWIPTGALKTLGTHPELGFQLGAKHKKMNYDLTFSFKFVNSPNTYLARRSGVLEPTKQFFGGYIGVDVGRDIYFRNGNEWQVIGGIGFDGFDALKEDKDNDIESVSVGSYNFNFGLAYRYYVNNNFYIGLRAKYNVVDYTLNRVIDFTGNPITIQFIVGGVNNYYRNHYLDDLKYKYRK
ncbi:MAG TPA: autotransporter outer membrane beta-barrel domain-containing protein [Cyclobacteriaceae bacterium]|nr:autotransporter outer membrane beta-barrel domain-containing protein [Cyclobacteriaceae bacterium]